MKLSFYLMISPTSYFQVVFTSHSMYLYPNFYQAENSLNLIKQDKPQPV